MSVSAVCRLSWGREFERQKERKKEKREEREEEGDVYEGLCADRCLKAPLGWNDNAGGNTSCGGRGRGDERTKKSLLKEFHRGNCGRQQERGLPSPPSRHSSSHVLWRGRVAGVAGVRSAG